MVCFPSLEPIYSSSSQVHRSLVRVPVPPVVEAGTARGTLEGLAVLVDEQVRLQVRAPGEALVAEVALQEQERDDQVGQSGDEFAETK